MILIEKATNKWLARIDKGHIGYPQNHISVNPGITGLTGKTKIDLPPGGLTVGKNIGKAAKTLNKVNKVLTPISYALDAASLGISVVHDVKCGTSRNTVTTAVGIAAGFGGAYCGATLGATLGTFICPGIGTIAGSVLGSFIGGFGGSAGSEALTDAIGDGAEWDIKIRRCSSCGRRFKIRRYRAEEDRETCEGCR
ncbi:hypothetical protein FGIG_07879 [Fasciola gigantica]|uniref:Uncharacterized protein n=1 Tax=Fasciola gigantica TaxID=46835 RepID=A0A504YZQ8_FASGI|nr:hypothetical protein FGIG_07879 [Fasciola gigantica]